MIKSKTIIVSIIIIILTIGSYFALKIFDFNSTNSLLNTTWQVIQYNGQNINNQIILSISPESVNWKICNNISYGPIKITSKIINFHNQASSTMMACEPSIMEVETNIIQTFSEPSTYLIENNNLILINGRSRAVLIPT